MKIRMICLNKVKMKFHTHTHSHVCFFKLINAIIWKYYVKHEGKYIIFFIRQWFINPFIARKPLDHSFNPEQCQWFRKGFNVLSCEGSLIVFCFILCLFTSCA